MPRQKLKSLEWKLSNREYIKNNDNGDQINSACVCETCGTTSYSENSANTLCLPCRDLEKVGLGHKIRKSEKTTWITKRNGTIKSQTTSTGLIVNLCNCCKEEENTCDCGWCDCCEECYEHDECNCDSCELCEECEEHDVCDCCWCECVSYGTC